MAAGTATAARPFRAVGGLFAMSLDTAVAVGKRPFQWRELIQQMWFLARVSLVPTVLVMLGFNLLVIYQVNLVLQALGALDLSGGAAGIASVQQIGPFVTVLVIAGAGCTAMCADLGARTIREEIAAMEVLGIDPIQRLVVPRVLATIVVAQVLNFIICTGGLLANFLFSVYLQGATPAAFVDTIPLFTGQPELMFSVIKAFVFGLVAALVACHLGLTVSGAAKGLGDAVTQSVVISVMVLTPAVLVISVIQFELL